MSYEQDIEAYLNNELDETMRQRFETAVQHNEMLAQALKQRRSAHRRLEAMQLRLKVQRALDAPGESSDRIISRTLLFLLLTGMIAVATGLLFLKKHPAPQPQQPLHLLPPAAHTPEVTPERSRLPASTVSRKVLATRWYIPPPDKTLRSSPSAADAFTQELEMAMGSNQHRRIIVLLSSDSLVTTNSYLRFLRANASFRVGDFAQAATDFSFLENTLQYRYEGRWNGLLCQLAEGRKSLGAVKKRLREMSTDPAFPFRKQAANLLKALSRN
jgi:hypothetical protein